MPNIAIRFLPERVQWSGDADSKDPGAGAGPKTRGSFSAIVALNNPWELRIIGLTQHANASAHDIRRGFAQRLINLGVSAETLKVVLRHRDFATTEKFYGAIRSAQSAAREVRGKLLPSCDSSALVGGHEKAPRLSTEELRKRKAVIYSL